jgi:hypothetical protein
MSSRRIIHERSNIIPISPSSPTKNSEKEYSLKENFFDPSKSSPPNEFLKKLQQRMNIYNSPSCASDSTSDSLDPNSLDSDSLDTDSLDSDFSKFSFSFINDDNCDIE